MPPKHSASGFISVDQRSELSDHPDRHTPARSLVTRNRQLMATATRRTGTQS